VSEIKCDSQAYELAKQRTLLPGERELLAKSGATGRRRSASQGLPVLGAFRSRVRKYPSASLSAGPYFALGDTNVFARPVKCDYRFPSSTTRASITARALLNAGEFRIRSRSSPPAALPSIADTVSCLTIWRVSGII
jgi:hypothetical protein